MDFSVCPIVPTTDFVETRYGTLPLTGISYILICK
jgi:hypothetical protein